jgi:hypothetical protein
MRRIIARIEKAGVVVRPISGWEHRGATFAYVPVGIIDHHDASSRKSGEWGALGAVTTGFGTLPGPLSQFVTARCLDDIPKIAIVAAGRANHAGRGGPRTMGGLGVGSNAGNGILYGNEKANDGRGEPHTAAAHYAADAVFAAVLAECRGAGVDRLIGHKEWATPSGRKGDPEYSMDWRRTRVGAFAPVEKPVTPIPPAVPKEPSRYSKVSEATQRAVHTPVDGFWGVATDTGVNVVRHAINGGFPLGVGEAQRVVGAKIDGAWGPNSRGALAATIKALQIAWGTGADGVWGRNTEAAWQRARAACFIK